MRRPCVACLGCRCHAHGFGHMAGAGARCQAAREQRRAERVQVGVAREPGVERFEPARGGQEQGQRLVAAVRGEGDLRAHEVDACLGGVVERHRLSGRQEGRGVVERPGVHLELRAVERPPHPACRIGRQRGGLLEERRCRRHAAVGESAARRLLELCGHRLVGAQRRASVVPGAPVGVDVGIGDVGERPVDLAPFGGRGRSVDGRPDEGVPEPGMVAQLDQARGFGRARRLGWDAESLHGAPEKWDVADRFRRRDQQQPSGCRRQRCQPAEEAPFEAVDQREWRLLR